MAYSEKQTKKQHIRTLVLTCMLALLLLGSVLGVIAYMQAHSHISNTFTVAVMKLDINETFDGSEKSDVKVLNQGDVPAYLRAAVVVNWKDADGNILLPIPEKDKDYSITMGDGWTRGSDGYWYCKSPVAVEANSPVLIEKCERISIDSGKHLSVDILVQGVQAAPLDAVKELWGATVSADGTLKKE